MDDAQIRQFDFNQDKQIKFDANKEKVVGVKKSDRDLLQK